MIHLDGLIDSTRHLPTPLLAVDSAVLRRNIEAQQAACNRAGIALRPHIKTHKSSAIARLQLDAGAAGVTCATLSEAIALGEAGCGTDVYVSTPIFVDQPKRRLVERAIEVHTRLTLTVDSTEVAASVMRSTAAEVGVMIEVDCGLRRTGLPPERVSEVAGVVGDRLRGFATHGGHGYRPQGAESAATDERSALTAAWETHGRPVDVLSAGSTPTAPFALGPPITELRPGTYVFGDHQQVVLESCRPEDVAAAVVSTVIHVSEDRLVIDAGAKSLSKDRADWLESYGHVDGHDDLVIDRLNDNHGMMTGRSTVSVGDRVAVVPNHICPVVNLFEEVHLDNGQAIPIDLRGRLV